MFVALSLTFEFQFESRAMTEFQAGTKPAPRGERKTPPVHLGQLANYARDTVLLLDETGAILECNDAALAEYGYMRDEMLRFNIRSLRAPESHSALAQDLQKAAGKNGATIEAVHLRKDGSTFPVESSSHLIEVEGRRYIHATIRDISARKAGEQALQREVQRYRAIMQTAIDGIHIVDRDGRLVEANPAFLRMIGYDREEAIGLHIGDWDSRFKSREMPETIRSLIGRGETFETEHRRKDGSIRHVEVSANAIENQGETYLYCAARDITEYKHAEKRIERLTRMYATLSHANQAIVRARSEDELFAEICRVAVEKGGMLGAAVRIVDEEAKILRQVAVTESLRSVSDKIVVSIDPALPELKSLARTAYSEDRVCIVNELSAGPSAPYWQQCAYAEGIRSVAALPIRRGGKPVGVFLINERQPDFFDSDMTELLEEMATDISFILDHFEFENQRKRSESALAESEEQFRGLVEQSIAGAYIIQDGKFAYVNPRFAEIFGYGSANEVVGRDASSLVAEKDRSAVAENVRRRVEGKPESISYEFTGVRKDGSTIDVGVHGARATHRDRPAIIGLIQDISEKKRAEEQIRHYVAQLETAFMSTVEVATTLSEMRDPYTAGHERRVAEIAVAIGTELGFDARRLEGLRVAGHLHDIGKITVPTEILAKPGKLTSIEFQLIKGHAQASYDVLKDVNFPWPVAQVALQHHERMDGSGYPRGLKGEEILFEARIMAVADVIEAMASHRPYRPGLGIGQALAEIERGRGSAYDPAVADACLRLFRGRGYQLPA